MKCRACTNVLRPWEQPEGFCDDCLRAHQWKGGSPESLERLVNYKTDDAESDRIASEHPLLRIGEAGP